MTGPVTPLTKAETTAAEARSLSHPYPVRLLIALDQFGAVLFGARNDTTISGDAGIAAVNGKGVTRVYGKTMSAFLNLFQKNHSAKAVAGDMARAEEAAQYDEDSGVINQ